MLSRFLGAVATLTMAASAFVVVAQPRTVMADTQSVQPARVLDTRNGIGRPTGKVGRGDVVQIPIPGPAAGASAITLNVTATESDTHGFVKVWSCADAEPETSNLNYVAGRSVPNMVVARVVGDTPICLRASSAVHLIADFMGSYTGDGDVVPTAPRRIVDTRHSGDPLQAGQVKRIRVAGTPGIPATATAAMLNLTVVDTAGDGFLSAYPCPVSGNAVPNASTLNFQPGDTVAAFTMTALSGGDICIWSNQSAQLIVDTFGWVTGSGAIRVKNPTRVLDTRNGIWSTGPAAGGQTITLRVAGRGGVPNTARAALLTLTVADVSAHGFVTAWPCDEKKPNASVLNFWPGAVRANSALLKLSHANGEICLSAYTSDGSSVSLIADAVGWVPGSISRPPVPPPPAPPSGSGHFSTLPVGALLPSGAQCATRVRPTAEVRAANAIPNSTKGTTANASYPRVDGNFTGTTDEILQWAACKWGIDEDIVRAQIAKESWWNMSAVGDGGQSFGLGQVRDQYHSSAFVDDNAKRSSAYNVDYTYAFWRSCYEGEMGWLNTVERGATYAAGDLQGCLGVWFSGRWHTQAANDYITAVESYREQRIWQTSGFLAG